MSRDPGFSLLEVLFATTILTAAVLTLSQLMAAATHANASARTSSLATLLAAQKMEQLRARSWAFDASGAAVSDIDAGGALDRDVDGFADWLDATGRGVLRADAATFIRRWSVAPLPSHVDTLVLQVVVIGPEGRTRTGRADARLVTVKTRKSL